ncbi:hypothetical protein Pmar_PMAR028437, partial [Perkinsus marinus ATCC 50983]
AFWNEEYEDVSRRRRYDFGAFTREVHRRRSKNYCMEESETHHHHGHTKPTAMTVQIRELMAEREAQEEDLGAMRKMVEFLSDRCQQLEAAYNDRETRFRREMEEMEEQHKRDMALVGVEMSELESRVEALSDIKHELNFRVQQLEAAHASGKACKNCSVAMQAFGKG